MLHRFWHQYYTPDTWLSISHRTEDHCSIGANTIMEYALICSYSYYDKHWSFSSHMGNGVNKNPGCAITHYIFQCDVRQVVAEWLE